MGLKSWAYGILLSASVGMTFLYKDLANFKQMAVTYDNLVNRTYYATTLTKSILAKEEIDVYDLAIAYGNIKYAEKEALEDAAEIKKLKEEILILDYIPKYGNAIKKVEKSTKETLESIESLSIVMDELKEAYRKSLEENIEIEKKKEYSL